MDRPPAFAVPATPPAAPLDVVGSAAIEAVPQTINQSLGSTTQSQPAAALPSISVASPTTSITAASQITSLEALIATLTQELQALIAARSGSCTITKNLAPGSKGADVTCAQTILISQGLLAGTATGYYGVLTTTAVKSFQKSQVLISKGTPATTGYGATGPQTRAALNALHTSSGGSANTTTTTVATPSTSSVGSTSNSGGGGGSTVDTTPPSPSTSSTSSTAPSTSQTTTTTSGSSGSAGTSSGGSSSSSSTTTSSASSTASSTSQTTAASTGYSGTAGNSSGSGSSSSSHLSLNDLFNGTARFQTPAEADIVSISLANNAPVFGQQLPVIYDKTTGRYFRFTRRSLSSAGSNTNWFTMVLVQSTDGLHFTEVGPLFNPQQGENDYDAQLAVDNSVTPVRYVLTFECQRAAYENSSSCSSYSTTPFDPTSWSTPVQIVSGCNPNSTAADCGPNPGNKTASMGLLMFDGNNNPYLAWTVLNNTTGSAYTRGIAAPYTALAGHSEAGQMLLPADNVGCAWPWDCANRNATDWKKEGSWYYLIYNGSKNDGCLVGPDLWGLAIARSQNPLGPYPISAYPLIRADRTDICGLIYGSLNSVGGDLYMYYSFFPNDGSGQDIEKRSKLIPTTITTNNLNTATYEATMILKSGESKTVGDLLLVMQPQVNLVLYQEPGDKVLWASGGGGPGGIDCQGACYAAFQEDGNLVLYQNSLQGPTPYFNTGAAGAGSQLKISDTYPYISIVYGSKISVF